MAEMEIEMTKNPITGEVPKNKLYEVRQEIMKQNRFAERRDGEEWVARGPNNVGGRSRAILVDRRDPTGNTVWTGSVSGGLWRVVIDDEGPTWTRIEGYLGNPSISCIIQDPEDAMVMYLGTGEGWFNGDAYRGDGIYKSVDGGETWERLIATSNGTFDYVQKMLFTEDGNILAATRDGGVRMSTDDGVSWVGVLTNSNQGFSNRAADLEITSDGTIFASAGIFTQDGIYRSTDGGLQWDFLELDIEPYERIEIATSPNDPDLIIALAQDEESRECAHILRSTDKGATWTELSVPTTDFGGNFARNQAWYDLIAGVDPNDSDVIYVGGVNLYKTIDGGQSWTQLSEWFSGSSRQEVHADQHNLVFVNGTSSIMYFSNDGGLYKTTNASQLVPDIIDQSAGYISTQFYACDIHPEAGRDFFLAGAQDNGTNQLQSPEVGPAVEVLGGDGAVCHISQLDGNVQIGSFQRGGFTATFGGNLQTGGFYGHEGQSYFINPTELDDENLFVYASQSPGHFYRTNLTTNRSDSISISVVPDERATALTVSPHDSDILFIGTNNGTVVKVMDPRGDSPTSEILFEGFGFSRNIDVDPFDADRMIVTYSSFGVESIYLTEDGGITWRSIEGNLPDMPVRWGIFSPRDNNEILIATELGVWSGRTDGASVDWQNVSPEIGLTRVNQLRYRASDLEMAAATYGRGLYTTSSFAKAGLRFNTAAATIIPSGAPSAAYCDPTEILTYTISTPVGFDDDVDFEIGIGDQTTAIRGVDFELLTDAGTIPAGEKSVTFDLLILDNATVSGDRLLQLTLISAEPVVGAEMQLLLREDDRVFNPMGGTDEVTVGSGSQIDLSVFNGFWEGARTQLLYSADYLAAGDVSAGEITEIAFDVLVKVSSLPYENYTVSMALVSDSDFSDQSFIDNADMTTVFMGDINVDTGKNSLVLDQPFLYDGQRNLLLEICFDNDDYTDDDVVAATEVNYVATINLHDDGQSGCPASGDLLVSSTLPDITFVIEGASVLFDQVDREFSSSMVSDAAAYFESGDSLYMSARNNALDDICLTTTLVSSGADVLIANDMLWLDRIHDIVAEGATDLEITVLMPLDGSDAWLSDDIEGLYTAVLPSDGSTPSWTAVDLISIETTELYHAFSMPYVGDGYYTVGEEEYLVSTKEIDLSAASYDQVLLYNVAGQVVSRIGMDESLLPAGIYFRAYIKSGRVAKTIKVFLGE